MMGKRRTQSMQMLLRLRDAEQRVQLETAPERDLINALAALLHAAVRTDVDRAQTDDDGDE